MIRKIITIDEEKCNGCGACAAACHEGAIEMVNGKAKLTREDYCDGLGDCLPACPMDAISFEEREAPAYNEAAPLLISKPEVENIIPIRKSGKLPFAEGDLQEISIMKEYGADHLYYRLSDIAAGKVEGGKIHISIIDDVLATGGTAEGIAQSLQGRKITKDGVEYEVVINEFIFLVELDFLKGAERLEKIAPVKSLIHL